MSFAAHLAAADRAALDILGGPVRYAPRIGAPVDVTGVFDLAFVRVDAGTTGVSSSGPAVFLRLADLPSDPGMDKPQITVEGVIYNVAKVEKDGLGGVLLRLHRA